MVATSVYSIRRTAGLIFPPLSLSPLLIDSYCFGADCYIIILLYHHQCASTYALALLLDHILIPPNFPLLVFSNNQGYGTILIINSEYWVIDQRFINPSNVKQELLIACIFSMQAVLYGKTIFKYMVIL